MKLLTFLGTNDYKEVIYYYKNSEVKTRFIQEALAKLLPQPVEVIVYATESAYYKNWKDSLYEGLETVLKKEGFRYEVKRIYDGKNSNEIWENFNIVYGSLINDDKISVDITHSLRSIPILITSIINYGQATKNIDLQGIYYGAYETMDAKKRVPVFDLTVFENMNQWAVGSKTFLNVGNGLFFGKAVSSSFKAREEFENLKEQLKTFIETISVVRSTEMREEIKELKDNLKNIRDNDAINDAKKILLNPALDQMQEILQGITGNDLIEDINEIIKLCIKFGLMQQAYTLLRENIINYVCVLLGYNIEDVKQRQKAENILYCYKNEKATITLDRIPNRDKFFINETLYNAAQIYKDIGNYRNDLNHAGFVQDTKKWNVFMSDITGKNSKHNFINDMEKLYKQKL